MAGIVVPSVGLLVAMTVFCVARLVYRIPIPIERVIVFPMALVPNLFGPQNMLYVWLRPRRHLPIGFHGALALPVSKVASMVQVIEDSLWQNRLSTVLLSLFAALALILAAIGIYGTLSYVVQQSLAEAGIRLALGATPTRILRSTLRGAMAPALVGTFFGLLCALALTRFIAGYLYGITATDPWTLVASAVLLLAIALVAGIVPARRAAFVDPMAVLRHE